MAMRHDALRNGCDLRRRRCACGIACEIACEVALGEQLGAQRALAGRLGRAASQEVREGCPVDDDVALRRQAVDDPIHHGHRRLELRVGRLAFDELESSDAERPDVDVRVVALARDELRSHPVGCPNHSALLHRRAALGGGRHPKVGELDPRGRGEQHVARLDIPMEDTQLVV